MDSSNLVLAIFNRHIDDCGSPPNAKEDGDSSYVGYYQSIHGDQWILRVDSLTGKVTLQGGDSGWANTFDVTNGPSPDLVMDIDELAWLEVCLRTIYPEK